MNRHWMENSTAALEIQQRDATVVHPIPECHLLLFKARRGTLSFLSESYNIY